MGGGRGDTLHPPRGHHLSTANAALSRSLSLAQGYRGLYCSPKELKSSQEGRRPRPSSTALGWAAGPAPKPGSPGLAGAVTQSPRLAVRLRFPGHAAPSSFSNDAFHTPQSPGAARASTGVTLIRVCRPSPQAVQLRPGPGGGAQGSPCPQLNGSPLGNTGTIALRQTPTCPGRQQQDNTLGLYPRATGSSSLRKPRLRRLTGFPTQHAPGLHPLGGTSGRTPARTRSPRSQPQLAGRWRTGGRWPARGAGL